MRKILLLLIIVGAGAVNAAQKPNIIWMFSDDHTRQAIGAYKGILAKLSPTPNLDRLAKEGMRFDRCYVENSICAPSRAALMTGKFSHKHGKKDNIGRFDHNQQTFPKILQKAGYQTAIVGKTHLDGKIQGFDHWETLPGQGSYYQPSFVTKNGMIHEKGYVADVITRKSIDWLNNSRDPEKPFMLMIHHKGTHRTWMPALRHISAFNDIEVPYPANFWDDYGTRGTAARVQDMTVKSKMNMRDDLKVKTAEYRKEQSAKYARHAKLPKGEPGAYFRMTPQQKNVWDLEYDPKNQNFWGANPEGDELVKWKYQRYVKDYLRTALSIDESMGEVLDCLKENGLDKNTIVMYSSDQGFYLGEHGWFDKRFMYEESFSTPLLARWPGKIKPGSVNKDLCQNVDFAETFLDLAGAKIPSDMQGKSLVPLLTGETPDNWRKSLYYRYYEVGTQHKVIPHEGVVMGSKKLIHFYASPAGNKDEWELYDLDRDPSEMQNKIDNPEYAPALKSLRSALAKLREQYEVTE